MGFFTMRAISHANEIEDTNMKTICPKYLHDRA